MKKNYSGLETPFWKGALAGIPLIGFLLTIIIGFYFNSGLPVIVNVLIAFLAGVILFSFLMLIFWLLRKLVIRIPIAILICSLGALGLLIGVNIFLRYPATYFYPAAIMLMVIVATFSGFVYQLRKQGFASRPKFQKIMIPGVFAIGLGFIIFLVVWLASSGSYELNHWEHYDSTYLPAPIKLSNPGVNGAYAVKKIFYGSGKDKRREEYGKAVTLKTDSVDASLLLPQWKDFKKDMREWYWGFGIKNLPLNGTVWYPEGDGKFPMVLIVHGNHSMEEYSDPGYAYLGELLASKGYIVVSVDENFVNATWSGDFVGKEMQLRAWLLLKHLSVWREWNQTPKNIFYQKVNLDEIALIGHSRGGEAVAIAAAFNKLPFYPDNAALKFDFNFKIKSLVAIAPTDRRYTRRMQLKNINYLTLQGGYDSDEPAFFGIRQAERISFSHDPYFFKAGLYIPGANHGQFNSVWKKDSGPPYSWLVNEKPLIKEKDQQQIAKVYIAAFLDVTLNNKKEYVPVFENWAYARRWLPVGHEYVNRFEDNRFIPVAGFEEDIDITTGTAQGSSIVGYDLTVWREKELFYRDGDDKQANSVTEVGWNKKDSTKTNARYVVNIPALVAFSYALTEDDLLTFALSAGDPDELTKADDKKKNKKDKDLDKKKESIPDFSIVLTDSLGATTSVPAHELIQIQPRWKIQYLKLESESSDQFGDLWDPTLQSFQMPLSYFVKKNPTFNISTIRKIEFRFDKTDEGMILLDKIGFDLRR